MSLTIVPCTLAQANAYINTKHRHHQPVTASRFALAVADESGKVRGVAIVGLPVARMYCPPHDLYTAEVRRVCTDGCKNACSLLYAAAWRAARNIGYKRLITYTLETESGTSLRAAGWHKVAKIKARSWDMPGRRRAKTPASEISKWRWEIEEKRPAFGDIIF
jgi:hypothetical protein